MTMENQEVLMDERLRNRVINAEYGGITEEKVRAIYIEETGKELPATIAVYNSEDYIDNQGSYGVNGTIIHFFDEQEGINQTYTIPRGSEKGDQETRSEEHTSELQSRGQLVCRLLLEKKKEKKKR